MYPGFDDDREWLTVDECAHRLGTTPARVRELAERGVLRARSTGFGVEVEPAIVAGITT